jgi:hypothetical protein
MPTKEWSPRLATKAIRLPSGEYCMLPTLPRTLNSFFAGVLPSMGTIQGWSSRVNSTRSPLGAMTGSSPSPRRIGAPPAVGTDHTWIFGAAGLESGLGEGPSQLPP